MNPWAKGNLSLKALFSCLKNTQVFGWIRQSAETETEEIVVTFCLKRVMWKNNSIFLIIALYLSLSLFHSPLLQVFLLVFFFLLV